MNIRQIFNSGRGYTFKDYEGTFGIEVETETESLGSYPSHFFHLAGIEKDLNKYDLDSVYWYAIEDHSLRNYGMEFVLKKPLVLVNALDALDEFHAITKDVSFIECPPGASVHVHVNMLPETCMTLVNFMTLWVMFENPLVEFCGVPRRSNLFALPVRVAEQGVSLYGQLFKYLYEKNDFAFGNFTEEQCKYAALNIATLSRLGTVEVRTMRGTTNVELIKLWLMILHKMLEYSRSMGVTPLTILQEVRDDPTDLMKKVFGTYSVELMNTHWKSQVERNLHYVYNLVDSVPSFDNFADYSPVEEKKIKSRKLNLGQNTINVEPYFTQPIPSAPPVSLGSLNPYIPTAVVDLDEEDSPENNEYTDDEISNMSQEEFDEYIHNLTNQVGNAA